MNRLCTFLIIQLVQTKIQTIILPSTLIEKNTRNQKIFKKLINSNMSNLLNDKNDTDKAKINIENKKSIKFDNEMFSLENLRLYF